MNGHPANFASSDAQDGASWPHGRMADPGWRSTPDEGLIEQTLRIVRKRKWLILQATLIVPAIALVLSLLQTEEYTATSGLLFRDPVAGAPDQANVDPNRRAATNEELIALPTVAERTARRVGGGLAKGDIQSSVEFDSPGDADIVKIKATDESPRRAAAIANAYAETYIAFRRQADQTRVAGAIEQLQRDLRDVPTNTQAGIDERRQLRQQIQDLQVTESVGAGNAELVQRAEIPSSPSSPRTKRNVLLGLLLGAIFGLGLASLRERTDRRLKSEEELEEIYGLPILARIPRSRTLGKQAHENPMRALTDAVSQSREAEAFRTLRANLRYFNVDRPIRSILVASPVQGEGKSTVATFLAVTMASMGDRVVLVEADLRKAGEPGLLPDPGGEGLSLVLAGFELDEALIEVPISVDVVSEAPRTLAHLPRGPMPPNPSELLESERMRSVLAELEERFDLVIIDTPALSTVADALSLVPQVSGVVVVSSLTQTTEHAAYSLRKQLTLLGGHPLGIAANFASPTASDYYYYYPSERRRSPA